MLLRAFRSTRSSAPPVRLHEDDEDYSPGSASSSEPEDSDDSDESEPERPPVKRRKSSVKPDTPSRVKPEPRVGSLLTVERAKTGRAKCRKCHEVIEAGAWRVGMEAWIMGRQAMTWFSICISTAHGMLQATPRVLHHAA